jgi:hypothetical protein
MELSHKLFFEFHGTWTNLDACSIFADSSPIECAPTNRAVPSGIWFPDSRPASARRHAGRSATSRPALDARLLSIFDSQDK